MPPPSRTAWPAVGLCLALLAAGCKDTPGANLLKNVPTPTVRITPGQTLVTLSAATVDGTPATPGQLNDAATVLVHRFTGAGLPAPTVDVGAAGTLHLTIAAQLLPADVESLVRPGVLTFRPVLSQTGDAPVADHPVPAGPATSGVSQATLLAQVEQQLGDAYTLAASLTDASTAASDPATLAKLAPFADLTSAQVAVLPPNIQFDTPTVSCAQLNGRNPSWLTDPRFLGGRIVACDAAQSDTKYLLGAVAVQGTDLAGSSADYDPTSYSATGGWYVTLTFTAAGQQKWTAMTAAQVNNQVAMVLDAEVVSAPTIQETIHGPAVISGTGITEPFAQQLASDLNAGGLPLDFVITGITVTP